MHEDRKQRNCCAANAKDRSLNLTPAEFDSFATIVADKVVERLSKRQRCGATKIAEHQLECGDSLAVNYKEAARLVGVHERTIWSLCKEGKLKTIAIGRAKRVLRSSIADYIASNSK